MHAGSAPSQVRRVHRLVRQRERRAAHNVTHDRLPLRVERGEIGGDPLHREARGDAGPFFDPGADKAYRHPQFYKVPRGVRGL